MGNHGVWYCTRESVKTALSEQETARSNAEIDDAIEQGARDVEGLCNRDSFAPILATHSFDFPSRTGRPPSWRLWFGKHSLASDAGLVVTSENGATTLTSGQYVLRPEGGPPYTRMEIDLSGSAAFSSAGTWQNALSVTGLWAHARDEQRSVGSLSSILAASTTATASLAWTTARIGVGDILIIDSERVIVNERTFTDSTQNLGAALGADDADTQVTVSDGTAFAVEEIISVGGERMRVVDVIGNVLTVRRAWDGSQLAAHLIGVDIYALTGVELARAQCGTVLAAHSSSAAVYRWVPPGPVAALNRAYALDRLLQERSGYARTLQTSGDTAVEFTGRGIAKLERDVEQLYGRRARTGAIV